MLKPISNTIQGVINFTWPMVVISLIIMVSFRICYLIKSKEKVVIYGTGMIGRHIIGQLKNTNIQVVYTIERGVANINGRNYNYREIGKLVGQPDVIVVTPLMEYMEIKQLLSCEYKCDIVSAEEVILSI